MDNALKRRGINYFNFETWMLFAPATIKISGYAPAHKSNFALMP